MKQEIDLVALADELAKGYDKGYDMTLPGGRVIRGDIFYDSIYRALPKKHTQEQYGTLCDLLTERRMWVHS